MDAQSTPVSSVEVKTSGQKVCLCVRGMILLVCQLPAATWSCSVLGPSRGRTGQGEMSCSSKFHLEIHFYPTAKSPFIPLHRKIYAQAGIFAFLRVYFKNMSLKYSDIEYFSSKEVHLLLVMNSPSRAYSGFSSVTESST